MDGQVSVFWASKVGASDAEYEDAYWPKSGDGDLGNDETRELRVIVADGASESMLAGRWARYLTTTFGQAPENLGSEAGFIAAYQRAAAGWQAELAQYKSERTGRNSPIQWYEEPGLARGAHATLLAVEFRWPADDQDAHWVAAAVGDSCLFQVRGGELLRATPVVGSADFSNQPALLCSNATDAEVLGRHLIIRTGDLARGDTCYLATDALAAWFLKMVEKGEPGDNPWRLLRELDDGGQSGFRDLISQLRSDGAIRDDDTTLVRVDIGQ